MSTAVWIRTLMLPYGEHASQHAEVHLPDGPGPHPVVVLLHGGLWRASWGAASMRPLAHDLAERGFAVLNLEFRRLGEAGAGWPGTFLDAVAGVALAGRPPASGDEPLPALDPGRVALVGHCSGGHLALWTAAWYSALWSLGAPDANALTVRTVVTLGGITDLRAAEREGLDLPEEIEGPPAAAALLGGDQDAADARYRLGSPLELLPLGRDVAQLLVHGDADEIVPIEHALRYARTGGQAGDRVRVAQFAGMGHFDMLDPCHAAWNFTVGHLRAQLSN